jgi:hypothetical protein
LSLASFSAISGPRSVTLRTGTSTLRLVIFGAATVLLTTPLFASGTTLSSAKGTTVSCSGIPAIVNRCVRLMENSGLIKTEDVGMTGLGFAIAGKDDGQINLVVRGSAGAEAGLKVGDRILLINGKAAKPTPGMIAAERVFGPRDAAVGIRVRRGGKELEFSLERGRQRAPRGPGASTLLFAIRPMINWKGQFIPCMGAEPMGFAQIDSCHKSFAKDGYVEVDDLGNTGLEIDLNRTDAAVAASITPGSAAAMVGMLAGDEIVQVNQLPLGESVGGILPELLFGRAGDSFVLTVANGESTRTVKLTLARKPKE